eukprot:gene36017-46795_t
MKRNRNAAYLGYFDQHHKAKSRRHNDQDDNEPIAYSEEDFMDTFEVERNDGQDDFDDEKVVADVVNTVNKAGETFHRIRVADFESKVSKVYKSFQFVDVVNRVVKFMNDPNHCLKRDDHVHLFRDSSVSKETDDDDDDDDSVESLSAENALPALKDYNRKVNRWFSFDQCINDCCVFVGTPTFKMFACPTCHARRYRACTRSKCKGKGNDDCNHLLDDGIAFKKLHYRMLIPLFIDLINTKYFVAALHYQNECLHGSEEKYYSDLLDGDVAKEHLNSMDLNFEAWCRENEATILDVKPVPVSLLLMDFYDGGQLFNGNRNFLPMDSYLRYFGQSGTCCPAGFYEPESKQWFVDEGFLSDSQPITAESLMDKATSSRSKKRKDREDFCEPCDKDETR